MANTYAYRTMDLTADGGYTSRFVFSAWVKRSKLSYSMAPLFSLHKNNSNTASRINCYFDNNDNLLFKMKDSGGSDDSFYATNRVFRDTNSWYHIYLAYNSTLSTAADRLQIYVNGVRETSFSSANEVGSDFGALMSSSMDFRIGLMKENDGTAYYFDGLMNSAIFTNYQSGTVDPVTDFGEVDSTTGEWKINVSPSVTYATQGVFVLKNGNSLTDQSGQSNNMTVGGTLTKTEDCPNNVFATLNVLERLGGSITVSNGNTQFFNQASDWRTIISNLAFPNTGKFYAEMQVNEVSSAVQVGIMAQSSFVSHFQADLGTQGQYNSYAYLNTGQKRTNNSASNYGNSFSGGIIGIAVDMDNKNIYFSKDGTWQNSGNPESGATGTGAAFTDLQIDKDYCFAVASQGSNPKVSWNFGNGFFGTSAVADNSTATASTPGVFNYAVPTGYQPLSTKGLNA